jgi:hypothetical protein
LLLPFLFVAFHFLNGLKVLETAGIGAGGFSFVTVEAVEMVHFGDQPRDGVGFTFAEMVLERVSDALAAEQNPMVLDGAGDQSGVVVEGGLIVLERVCEEGEEVFRVLAREEESLRGAAVTQIVHAGGKFACE